MNKFVMPVLAALAGVTALAQPASAGTAREAAQADLNGDGRADRVVVEAVAGAPEVQSLVATVNGVRLTARPPMDNYGGVQPLRVVDLDGDGRDEVLVVQSVGANTTSSGVWGLYGGLRPMLTADRAPLLLWEGGGISAISRYGCEQTATGRQLVTVGAQLTDWDNGVYEGERVTYAVTGRVATETSRTPVTGGSQDPLLQADPQTCA
ncbi:VCBS repeat-containing protein [Actinokineospora sp. PR83]|uniref:FG-GAP repeat domain-containing protein n=1 Tax=Actinokineospora sp. PR83 TaxID=2884908 RepID=UPI001F2C386D|nr:VCBS repeat-containing protein [Actinokineospora sp. PR83]MCG8919725.1 VCBS repeat-containing protein [Actinokineospora sp. PR83]